ncbi:MAG: iojap-related protein [Acidobacteria bacterium]|nr:iojap-related protein [Acidobacteriota bacterium]
MKDNSTIKEKSLQPVEPAVRPAQRERATEKTTEALDERILIALHAASDKKALDLILLDLREIATFTDYFLITSGANQRQVQAIADEVVDKLKKAGSPAARIEGYRTAEWILVDYGDFVLHVFEEKSRKFYDLERLWRESKRVELPVEVASQHLAI